MNGSLWDDQDLSRLHRYHLHYFDYLRYLSPDHGLTLMLEWIRKFPPAVDVAWEPYPLALRVVNWIHFLEKSDLDSGAIDRSLYQQVDYLFRRLEFEIDGNHLFKDLVALAYGGWRFDRSDWVSKAERHLRTECMAQTIAGGLHYELSPTYHALFTLDLLDLANALPRQQQPDLGKTLDTVIPKALGWLGQISHQDHWLPLNDANYQDCPNIHELISYGSRLGYPLDSSPDQKLYQVLDHEGLRLLMDTAPMGPDHIPGHAHADMLAVLLWDKGLPILVDTGNYEYVEGERRVYARSTLAHNTLLVNGENQAELWSVFRMGRRGSVHDIHGNSTVISGTHTGYGHLGVYHTRTISTLNDTDGTGMEIRDQVVQKTGSPLDLKLYFHFHPDCAVSLHADRIEVDQRLVFTFPRGTIIVLTQTDYYPEMYTVASKPTAIVQLPAGSKDFRTRIERI